MSRFQAVLHEDRAEINLSPMLDVVFIMLIFFVVVATFIDEQGLGVGLPGSPDDRPDAGAITVRIESAGTFNVNGRTLSRASVASYVQALHGENPDADFAVMASDGVPVRDTVAAIEAGRAIGIEVVTIVPMKN